MTREFKTYGGEDLDPVVDLTEYLEWENTEFSTRSYLGESSPSTFPVRDELGVISASGATYNIGTKNRMEVILDGQVLWKGRRAKMTSNRRIRLADRDRIHDISADDINKDLHGIVVDGWVRPSETDVARVQALGAAYLAGSPRATTDLDVSTYVPNTNTVTLPAHTYNRTSPIGVLQEIAGQANKNFFVTIDDELFWDTYDSTAYATTLSISDRPADSGADGPGSDPLCYFPQWSAGPPIEFDGTTWMSGARMFYGPGDDQYVEANDTDQANLNAYWMEILNDDQSTDAASAERRLDAILLRRYQGLTYHVAIGPMTDEHIKLLKPGHLINIKARVIGAANSFIARRIVDLTISTPAPGQWFAFMTLDTPHRPVGRGTPAAPKPPGGTPALTCDNVGTAGVLTSKWANPSVESNVTGWYHTPSSGPGTRTTEQAHDGSWSIKGSTNHRWYVFDGQTFEAGKTYLFKFWTYTYATFDSNRSTAVGHSLVADDNHWTAGDYEDRYVETWEYSASSPIPADTWIERCLLWTPTQTWTDDVRIDFHWSSTYIDDCAVYEGAVGGVPLPNTDGGAVGTNQDEYALADHQHPLQHAAETPYDNEESGLAAANVQAAIDELAASGGVTDHGALTGLSDDDHPQYATNAEFDDHSARHEPGGDDELTGYVLKTLGGRETVNTVASSGTTETLNLATGNWHDVTLTDNCTFTFAGAASDTGCSFVLILRQDATGGRLATWPGSVVWPGGTAPTLSDDPNGVDILSFLSRDGGTTWYGAYPGATTDGGAHDHDAEYSAVGHEHDGSLPLTAVVNGEPVLLWDENDSLIGAG